MATSSSMYSELFFVSFLLQVVRHVMGGVIERQYAAACLTAGPAVDSSHSSPLTIYRPLCFLLSLSLLGTPTVLAANLIMIDT
jgi:hypothetical protein